jgi:hypothetical protein
LHLDARPRCGRKRGLGLGEVVDDDLGSHALSITQVAVRRVVPPCSGDYPPRD